MWDRPPAVKVNRHPDEGAEGVIKPVRHPEADAPARVGPGQVDAGLAGGLGDLVSPGRARVDAALQSRVDEAGVATHCVPAATTKIPITTQASNRSRG